MTLCRYYKIRPGKRTAQALEWVQGQIQNLILDNVTTDRPFYDDNK
jgi:hypothetical protein